MLSFSLLILCLNIDALSYGIANGAQKNRMSLLYILVVCIMSTVMFAIPLAISKYIFQYFDELVCRIINAAVLILLGINYFLPKKKDERQKSSRAPALKCFIECLIISVDAIFTALLSGFSENYYVFSVFFYAFSNFFAIFLGNRFLYKLSKISKLNLNFLSGMVFVLLGIFKVIGF